jgi:hypothetical protein
MQKLINKNSVINSEEFSSSSKRNKLITCHIKGNIQYNNFILITYIKHKDKVFSVQTMKACRGSRGIAPLILNVNTKWRKPLHRRLGGSQSQSEHSAGEKNPFNLPRIEAQTIQPVRVTISTMLLWVPKFVYLGESLWSQCNT